MKRNLNESETRYQLMTGARTGETIDQPQLIGSAFYNDATKIYRLKLMMFPGSTYYMRKCTGTNGYYTVFAKQIFKNGEPHPISPVGSAYLDPSLMYFLEIRFHLFSTPIFMSLFPKKENRQ